MGLKREQYDVISNMYNMRRLNNKIELEENLTNSRLLSITREIDKSYNKLLKEIRKYYKKQWKKTEKNVIEI